MGYIITGTTYTSIDNDDIVLVKTDMYGDTIWTKVYGGEYAEKSFCVQETYDGGFILAVWTVSFGGHPGKAWIIKTNETGDTLWTKMFSGHIDHIMQTHDSCYFLVGYDSIAVIRKMDRTGELLWTKHYGFCRDFSVSLEISSDNILVGGLSEMPEPPYSTTIELFMTNHNGDSIWLKQYGGIKIYHYLSLERSFDKGYIMSASEALMFEYPNMYLHKVDSLGNTQWIKTFGDEYSFDYARSVVQTSDSGFMLTGDREDLGLVLLKTNQYGDLLWEKGYDYDSISTSGYCLKNTFDDHFIVVGEALNIYTSSKDILLMKTDYEGLITRISENRNDKKLIVSPNPNNGNFNVHLSKGDIELFIYDLNGTTIFNKKISPFDGPTLRINNLRKGSYLIHIISGQAPRTGKILVM
nr:T9SS type A sorting domain-containing protein [Bacteroidota bacterium]